MPTFNDREKAEEAKYAHDQELEFKVNARRNKLLGLWAAELMGMSGETAEAYAREETFVRCCGKMVTITIN